MGRFRLEILTDSVDTVKALLNDTKYNFVAIGYHLRKIDDDNLYRETGHDNIWEFAKDQFGLSKSSASRFMAINKRFSVDGYSDKIADNYQQFNVSQMSEMLTLTDEQIGQIDASTTIREIRDMKPKPEKKEEPVEEPIEGQMSFDDYPGVVPEKEVVATSQQDTMQELEKDSCKVDIIPGVTAEITDIEKATEAAEQEIKKAEIMAVPSHTEEDEDECNDCMLYHNTDAGYMECNPETGEYACMLPDDEDDVVSDDPERYTEDDVKKYLRREEANLMVCRQESIRDNIRKHTVINVDAYGMLLGVMREEDEVLRDSHTANMFYAKGDYNSADFYLYHARKALNETKEFDKVNMPDINEFSLKIQELPVLKNNDQRGDFIDSFESWPLWIDCKETDEKIYRYDLGEGIALAVREKLRHKWIPGKYKYSETETEYAGHEFYLIGVEGKHGNNGFEFRINSNRTFYESLVNRSMLIEFIKKYQKGEVQ